MKIFSSLQCREWDKFSMEEQGVTEIELVHRAAKAAYGWLEKNNLIGTTANIFCGKGNNGADGLCLAAMLLKIKPDTQVYILETGKTGSTAFQFYLQELHLITNNIHFIQAADFFPVPPEGVMIIDALFGTGLNKNLHGLSKELVHYLNTLPHTRIALDLPSGMFADHSSKSATVLYADHTISFQSMKLAFFMAENQPSLGHLHILDIELSKNFDPPASFEWMNETMIKAMLIPRKKFSHKGNYGHAALVAGSYGMMGAAMLAAKGFLASGAGKLTCIIPAKGYVIMQQAVPEAMCEVNGEYTIESIQEPGRFTVIGAGPGIGLHKDHRNWLPLALKHSPLMVLDADALNVLADNKELLKTLPSKTLITPHPKEFDRLFGSTANDFDRLNLAMKSAAEFNIYILLKGHYSFICTPFGRGYFNCKGNAGMAKGGMGDVLTGFITGLLCSGYALPEAALLGAYLHGLAGDIAAEKYSQQAMQASHLVECIPTAWKQVSV